MYFQGPQRIVVLLLVLVYMTQHATSLDIKLYNNNKDLLEYIKAYLPGIFPQLLTYVPLPTNRSSCPKPAPGVRKLFQGVDVTDFDFYPEDGYSQGFKSTVLTMSCDSAASWYDVDGFHFDKPDQMLNGYNNVGGGTGTESVKTFKSTSDIRKEMTKTASLKGSYGFFSFSSSLSLKSMERTLQKSEKFIQEVTSYEASARAFNSYPTLDKHVQAYIDNQMTGTYDTNRDAYEKFIKLYGTHYFVRANLGGHIRVVIETTSDLLSESNSNDLKVSARATYNGLIKSGSISFGLEKGKSSTDAKFNAASSTSIKYYGGSANLLMAKGFTSWQDTVDADPWVVEGNLKPIASLITNTEKRKSLEYAVNKHIYRSFYKELVRSGTNMDTRGWRRETIKFIAKVMDGIQKTSETLITGRSKKQLEELIEHEYFVPFWFRFTMVCIRSRNTNIANTCNRSNTLKTNIRAKHVNQGDSSILQYFLVVSSHNQPKWFHKVRLCVRYRGDKDTSCKGSGEHCADGLQTETSVYYKSTVGAKADCNLSWKLSIPSDAPVWMSETKLCLYYGAHGVDKSDSSDLSQQCNRVVNPEKTYETCALTNQWTPYWRDGTTDYKQGKCWMSLTLKNLGDSIKLK